MLRNTLTCNAFYTAILQVLFGKVPYWWISEESQVLLEKGKGTWPFHPTAEV
jgi:hypothetical protein